jgi:hypothetical protein
VLIDGELDHNQDEQQQQRGGNDQLGASAVVMDEATPTPPQSPLLARHGTESIGRAAEKLHH